MTGATGFVGGALAGYFLASGVPARQLRLLVRDPRRAEARGLPRESLVAGDLADRPALARAAAGVDVTVHVAGAVVALSRGGFFSANTAGTAALVEVLRERAPGSRLVHVSSLAAAGPSLHGETSALPPDRCAPRSRYGESKRRGELHVQELGDALPWVIVRPPIVYGPGDAATRLLLRQATAPLVVVPWTRRPLSLIHVRDLVQALVLAAESRLSRRVLPVEGPNRLDTDEVMLALAAACGRRARLLRVPLAAAWPAAAAADALAWLRRRPGIFGRDKLRDLRAPGWVCDPVPAREALEFVPRIPTSVGFEETARAEGFAG